MKLAILSDSHDNRDTILNVLALLEEIKPDEVLHLGDVCSPLTLALFKGLPIRFCFGNCDWDRQELKKTAKQIGSKGIDNTQELTLRKKKILACHGDNGLLLNHAVASGEFDYVFHGHTHEMRDEMYENTRIINPGALMRSREYTFAVLEPETDLLKYYSVE